jgi:uncharacterized protein with HEPN domain
MLSAANDALHFTDGRDRHDLDTDRLLLRGLTHCIQEIGEAAARISQEGRAHVPHLPWGQIVGMRHILVHAYFSIDTDALWSVVREDLPTMVRLIEAALADWPAPVDDSGA